MNATTAPDTLAKIKMTDISKSDEFYTVQDAIAKFKCADINDDFINVTKLQKMSTLEFDDDLKDFPRGQKLKHILTDMGYHHVGRYKTSKISNQLIYSKDSEAKAIDFKDVIDPIENF